MSELKDFSTFFDTAMPVYHSDEHTMKGLKDLMDNHLMLLAEKDGDPKGFICGLINKHMFNPDIRTLTEIFWWVKMGERNTKAASYLIDSFVEWGKENVDWICFSIQQNTPIKPVSLVKRGFEFKEQAFLMEVQ